ncbi:MAG: response regulator transcription factor [Tannerella sp.]|jgi:DNA-binding NarL/FixJ family response regulator|nr:response regulator transcription factor [Tannerella sp.]
METKNNLPSINVAIVDDHHVIADAPERLISEPGTACVTGKAYSVAGCRNLPESRRPDVLLLDISMPDGSGIDLCRKIKETYPHVKVLMLTSYGELATIAAAPDAGASGYVLKSSLPEELLEGIHAVASGGRFLCGEASLMLSKSENSPAELTRREMELLRLIAEGLTLPEPADKMRLGVRTIRSYRKTPNFKLSAHNTARLLQNAGALKLIRSAPPYPSTTGPNA